MRCALAVLLLTAAAAPALAQTADRYGYAPPEAQVPMRQPLAGPPAPALRSTAMQVAAPSLRGPAASAPPLRMLSWPGKGVAGGATVQPASAPVAAVPRALAPAVRRPLFATAPAPRTPVSAPAATPSATAGVGPTPRPTYVTPPGLIARAPVAPPPAVAAPAAPQGVATMGPPRNPWYQRWPDAAAAPDPAVSAGVGASLAPGTPAAPPPAAPLAGYAPQPAGAAPIRTSALAPRPGGTAKYYSVHTAYGHAPDPAPIPPQFFGPNADLSAPETPEPARATLTANAATAKAAVNAARLQQGAAE